VAETYAGAAVGATHGTVRRVVTLVEVVRREQGLRGEEQYEEECKSAHDVRRKAAVMGIATTMPCIWLDSRPKERL